MSNPENRTVERVIGAFRCRFPESPVRLWTLLPDTTKVWVYWAEWPDRDQRGWFWRVDDDVNASGPYPSRDAAIGNLRALCDRIVREAVEEFAREKGNR
jgi:hypothetical protein